MSYNNREKAVSKAVVAVFETGKVRGNYSACAVLKDGAGISYGTHQATHAAGSLYKIVKLYTEISSDSEAQSLKSYLPLLAKKGKNTEAVRQAAANTTLKQLLRNAGKKQQMRYAQDYVFKKNYLEPAVDWCERKGYKEALSLLVVFDSFVHGNFDKIASITSSRLSEKAWIKAYCENRRNWLQGHSNVQLRGTAIRPITYLSLIAANNWNLDTPFKIHGVVVTEDDVAFHEALLESQTDNQEEDSEVFNEHADVQTEDIQSEDVQDNDTGDTADKPAPVDEYPAEPKPGEKVQADSPALMGARPTDAAVVIKPAEPESPTGIKPWAATVKSWWASLGLAGVSFGSIFSGAATSAQTIKFLMILGLIGLGAAIVAWVVYMLVRAYHVRKREQEAFELTKLEMQIRSDPTKYNVEVDKSVKVGETPQQDISNSVIQKEKDSRGIVAKIFLRSDK